MYAAIDEPINQVYTSGSETYAQIQPTVTKATLHAAPSSTSSSNGPTNNRLDEPSTSGLSQVAEIAEPTPRSVIQTVYK